MNLALIFILTVCKLLLSSLYHLRSILWFVVRGFQARVLIVQVRSELLPYSDLLSHWLSVFVRVTLFNFRTWRSK